MESYLLIVKMIGALALILGLMGLLFFFLNRVSSLRFKTREGVIKILESRAIGPKKILSLVKVGESVYLIAATESSVTLIDRISLADVDQFDKILENEIERTGNEKAL